MLALRCLVLAAAVAAAAANPFLECTGKCPSRASKCAAGMQFASRDERAQFGLPLCRALHASNGLDGRGKAEGMFAKLETARKAGDPLRVAGVVATVRDASSFNNHVALAGTVRDDAAKRTYPFDAFGVRMYGAGEFGLAAGSKVHFVVRDGRATDIARDGTPLAKVTLRNLDLGLQRMREDKHPAMHECDVSYRMDRKVAPQSRPALKRDYVPHCCPRAGECGFTGPAQGQATARAAADEKWARYAADMKTHAPRWSTMHAHMAKLVEAYDFMPVSPVFKASLAFGRLTPSLKTLGTGKKLIAEKAAALRRRDMMGAVLLALRQMVMNLPAVLVPGPTPELTRIPAKLEADYQKVVQYDAALLQTLGF